MKSPLTKIVVVFTSLIFGSLAASAHAQVIYRETFSSTVNNNTLSSWNGGWTLHRNTTGGGTVGNATTSAAVVSNATGRPSDVEPINAGTYAQNVTGLLFAASGDMVEALFFTTEHTWSAADLINVKWFMGNSATSVQQRAALQIGSQWYVSDPKSGSNIGGAGNFASQATQQTVNKTDDWFTLNYTLDSAASPFTIGATPTSLPTGTVNAMGIFTNTFSAGNSRFDTFEVSVIPEPSTVSLLAAIGALAVLVRRRVR